MLHGKLMQLEVWEADWMQLDARALDSYARIDTINGVRGDGPTGAVHEEE